MRRLFLFSILAAAALPPASAGTSVGVSIGINQPGVYGRIDIGSLPAPPVVYAQPVVIAPAPVAVPQRPIYLYVPVAHQANWGRYCGGYGACGQPVYFVQEGWVKERYQRAHPHADKHGHGQGHGQKKGRGNPHDD
jgi:hypothetical protein